MGMRTAVPSPVSILTGLRRRIPEGPVVPPPEPEVPRLPEPVVVPELVRTRWSHFLTVSIGFAAFVIAVAGLKFAADIAAPVFLALNLVIAAYPLQVHLHRRGLPAAVAATVTGLLVITVLLVFFALMGWSIAALVMEMPRYDSRMLRLYMDALAWLETQGITEQSIIDSVQQTVATQWQSMAEQGLGILQGILSNLSGVLSLLLVLVTVLLFLTMDTIGLDRRMALIRAENPHAAAVLKDFARGVRRYWVVTSVFGLIVAVLDTWALMILTVPLAAVWGVFSFLTNYIPNVGFVIGLVPPTLLALLEHGPRSALTVVVVYSVLNFVIQSLIQPKVAGDAVGLTPTVSFVSLLFWTWILGPLGALLALPASLLAKAVLVDGDREAGWVSYLIASSPESVRAAPTPTGGASAGATPAAAPDGDAP